MFLIGLLILVTAALSGSAGFFSVYGLAQTYPTIFIPVIIMGIALEAGKLVTASFLFHYWKETRWMHKIYMVLAVVALMVITSWGIFGFLGAAHQVDTIDLKTEQSRMEYIAKEKPAYEERLNNIDKQIAGVGDQRVRSKILLIKALNDEKKNILTHLDELTEEQDQLMHKKLTTEAKVGPIVTIASALHLSVDSATNFLTMLIMSVFDPLAVALTLAINVAIDHRKKILPAPESKVAVDDFSKRNAIRNSIRTIDN
jgi:hypothetical protein